MTVRTRVVKMVGSVLMVLAHLPATAHLVSGKLIGTVVCKRLIGFIHCYHTIHLQLLTTLIRFLCIFTYSYSTSFG